MPLSITPAAVELLRRDMAELAEPGDCFRVTVVSGGNSGLQFGFDPDTTRPGDIVLEFDGLTVVVDPVSDTHISGYTLDTTEGSYRFIPPS